LGQLSNLAAVETVKAVAGIDVGMELELVTQVYRAEQRPPRVEPGVFVYCLYHAGLTKKIVRRSCTIAIVALPNIADSKGFSLKV
jgi:hypothetical protein